MQRRGAQARHTPARANAGWPRAVPEPDLVWPPHGDALVEECGEPVDSATCRKASGRWRSRRSTRSQTQAARKQPLQFLKGFTKAFSPKPARCCAYCRKEQQNASKRKLKPLPPEPFRHQDSAIARSEPCQALTISARRHSPTRLRITAFDPKRRFGSRFSMTGEKAPVVPPIKRIRTRAQVSA